MNWIVILTEMMQKLKVSICKHLPGFRCQTHTCQKPMVFFVMESHLHSDHQQAPPVVEVSFFLIVIFTPCHIAMSSRLEQFVLYFFNESTLPKTVVIFSFYFLADGPAGLRSTLTACWQRRDWIFSWCSDYFSFLLIWSEQRIWELIAKLITGKMYKV